MKPTVERYMNPVSWSVGPDESLTGAKERMLFEGVRHLPVVEEGELVGLVSLSDLFVMEALVTVDPDETQVQAAMSKDLYTVERDASLGAVAREMSTRRISSAIVVEAGVPVGVFTSTDACRALAEFLSSAP